jgi:cation diffusion facilitator CzcD-associated flavoprotein CzcO
VARWNVTVEVGAERAVQQISCRFLHLCTGYYDYEQGYAPSFAGEEVFRGQRIHPQFWPKGFDYTGKRVVVVGSGATAVTLVPAMVPLADSAGLDKLTARGFIAHRNSRIGFFVGF